jgi:hypothetical protein
MRLCKRIFSSPKRTDQIWGPHSFLFNRYRDCFLTVKRPECKSYHSPPSSITVKTECSYISSILISLCGVDKNNFIFFHLELASHEVKDIDCLVMCKDNVLPDNLSPAFQRIAI